MKHKKIIAVILTIIIALALTLYNALLVNPEQLHIRQETLIDEKLDPSFDGFAIVFFSDLHYGMISDAYLDKVIDTINGLQGDIILFGGDLIDHYNENPLDITQKDRLIDALKKLEAPKGKFAVLGNHDLEGNETQNVVSEILESSAFTLLENRNVRIYNDADAFFELIGISSLAMGSPDIAQAYENTDGTSFQLAISHAPDIFDQLPESTDCLLAGHSHGGQIYLPLITSLFTPDGAKKYYHGQTRHGEMLLDITNGVGTTIKNIRLNADAEIVIYQLRSH